MTRFNLRADNKRVHQGRVFIKFMLCLLCKIADDLKNSAKICNETKVFALFLSPCTRGYF